MTKAGNQCGCDCVCDMLMLILGTFVFMCKSALSTLFSSITRACDKRGHRAGSRLKMSRILRIFKNKQYTEICGTCTLQGFVQQKKTGYRTPRIEQKNYFHISRCFP